MSSSKEFPLPSHLKVNERVSSKRALELEREIEDDVSETRKINQSIKDAKKKIKVKGSFNLEYWTSHGEVTKNQVEKTRLQHKISRNKFMLADGDMNDYEMSEEAKQLQEAEAEATMRQRLLEDHIQKLSKNQNDKLLLGKQQLLELLLALPISRGGVGLGEVLGQGPRDADDQVRFRNELIKACNTKHKDGTDPGLSYCPILGGWVEDTTVTAAHIFPYGAEQSLMDAFFGREDEDKPEMFEVENGLMMSQKAEKRISIGCMALVPGIRDDASVDETEKWRSSHPRPYKIHVFTPDSREMKELLPPFIRGGLEVNKERETWAALHGKMVQFRSDHRPRARYLYWQWMINMLKSIMSVKHQAFNPLSREFGKRFWGSGGKWLKQKYLLAFAEYAGHTFELDDETETGEASKPEKDVEPEFTAALAGVVHLRGGFLKEPPVQDEEEWDEEDED